MNKLHILVILSFLLIISSNLAQTSGTQITGDDGRFWTLPSTECDGNNFCEVRISPQGTIYGWDNNNRRLYVSQANQSTYSIYDLDIFSYELGNITDFIPFDELGYVMMFSPLGAGGGISQYNISTQTLQRVEFPNGYRSTYCNQYVAVRQLTSRFIFRLGADRFMACTTGASGGGPLIHIINANSLVIEQSLDLDENFGESLSLGWTVAGGLDNKIYAIVSHPESTIANLPQIDETTQEIILVYDVVNQTWNYEVKPKENTWEILAVLPDGQGIFFANASAEGTPEITRFSSDFQILDRIPRPDNPPYFGIFQGITSDGYMFFSTGPSTGRRK